MDFDFIAHFEGKVSTMVRYDIIHFIVGQSNLRHDSTGCHQHGFVASGADVSY